MIHKDLMACGFFQFVLVQFNVELVASSTQDGAMELYFCPDRKSIYKEG